MITPEKDVCACGGTVSRKLCDDLPGHHIYILACDACHHEYGPEWEEYHHETLCLGRGYGSDYTASVR
jgi:hypothetical protein